MSITKLKKMKSYVSKAIMSMGIIAGLSLLIGLYYVSYYTIKKEQFLQRNYQIEAYQGKYILFEKERVVMVIDTSEVCKLHNIIVRDNL